MESEKVDNIVEMAAMLAGKADVIEDVLILYTTKNGGLPEAIENGISAGDALCLMKAFEYWIIVGMYQK